MDTSLKKEKPAILDLYIPPPPAVPYSPRYVSVRWRCACPSPVRGDWSGRVKAVRISRAEADALQGDQAKS